MLVPLCNLRSLAALAPVSIIGVLGTVVTTFFLGYRCPAVVKSSPYAEANAGLLASMPASMQPQFSSYNRYKSPAPLILIAMGCVALMAHFSAPDFYTSLQDKNNKEETLKKYTKMTIAAYATVVLINALTVSFGFLTFGGACQGIILNNYADTDFGGSISRLLVAISVIGSFPILFGACRSSAFDLFHNNKEVTRANEKKYTLTLLSIITAVALVVKDAGFVVSFNGALMGTAIIYIFPALLFLKHTAERVPTRSLRLERWFNRFLVGFGFVSALIGAATSVLNSYFPHLLR